MLFHAANALPCPQCPSVPPMLFQQNKRGGGVARHGDALLFGGRLVLWNLMAGDL